MEPRLTDLGRLAASQLGEELRVLMGLVAGPSIIGAQGIVEGVLGRHFERWKQKRIWVSKVVAEETRQRYVTLNYGLC